MLSSRYIDQQNFKREVEAAEQRVKNIEREAGAASVGAHIKEKREGLKKHYSQYFVDVSFIDDMDIYRFLDLYKVTHPCAQHAIKKIACAGFRGIKDRALDIQEAIDALERMQEMLDEDTRA